MSDENVGGEGGESGAGEGGESGATGGESALATGGQEQLPLQDRIPEKYRVFEGEGDEKAFNLEASALKMSEGYSSLSKKLGSDDLPPDTPENYSIDAEAFGEDFNAEEFLKDDGTQSFLKRMHSKGMTNSQVQEVLEYGLKEWAPNLQAGNEVLNSDDCIKDLKENVWKSEDEYSNNMASANRSFRSLPQELQALADKELGNNPTFNRIMAEIGKEMSEDASPPDALPTGEEQAKVEELMMSEEYKNPNHPQHDNVSAKVRNYFERTTKRAS